MIRVLIADDQKLIVDLLTIALEQEKDIRVAACAQDGFQAQALTKEHHPDVILMDITMPKCDGIEATRQIKSWNQKVKVLILTIDKCDAKIKKALRAGADGYVLKNIGSQELIFAIKSVHANMQVVYQETDRPPLSLSESDAFEIATGKIVEISGQTVHLSKREMDLIRMITKSDGINSMADALEVEEGTIRNMITALIQKLQVKDRTGLAVFALKNNLLD